MIWERKSQLIQQTSLLPDLYGNQLPAALHLAAATDVPVLCLWSH